MNAPFYPTGAFSENTGFLVIFFLGLAFGFFLERAGFGSARKLTDIFYFRDWAVLRVMFTAIVVAMAGTLYLGGIGWLDMEGVSTPPTFLGAHIAGGLLLGVGFVVGGYCPGTSAVAAASGKWDALAYMAGLLFGTAAFGLGYERLEWLYQSGARGVVTLPDWMGVNAGIVGAAVVLMALAAFGATEMAGSGFRLRPDWHVVTAKRAGVAVALTVAFALATGYSMSAQQQQRAGDVVVAAPAPTAAPAAGASAPAAAAPGAAAAPLKPMAPGGVKRFKKGSSCS